MLLLSLLLLLLLILRMPLREKVTEKSEPDGLQSPDRHSLHEVPQYGIPERHLLPLLSPSPYSNVQENMSLYNSFAVQLTQQPSPLCQGMHCIPSFLDFDGVLIVIKTETAQ